MHRLTMCHFIYLFTILLSSRQYKYAFICGLYSRFDSDGLYVPYMNVIVHKLSLDVDLLIFKKYLVLSAAVQNFV
jgi:hypothetical protein